MDKSKFLKSYAPATGVFKMPDGEELELTGLTVAERGRMSEVVSKDSIRGQALVVCMSATCLDESDIDAVLEMDGQLIADIADEVMNISGLGGSEKN